MVRCGYCDSEILPQDECVKCHGCNNSYCYGCSIKENTYRNMTEEKKSSWRCQQKCKGKANTVSKATTSNKNEDEVKNALAVLTSKIDSFGTILNEVKQSQDFISEKYDFMLAELSELKKQNKSMSDEIKGLKRVVAEKDSEIELLQLKVNDLDQYGRRINLEISGVKEAGRKDTFEILENFADKIGVTFRREDFHAAHPLKNKNPERPPTILVQFVSRDVRDRWMQEGRKAYKSIPNGNPEKIYFNDNLTFTNRMLLRDAKLRAREKGFKYVWFKNCKIFARREENAPVIHIRSKADLTKIV
jgi:hypothetical protein